MSTAATSTVSRGRTIIRNGIGLPHAELSEEVAATVVLKPGATATVEALASYVAGPTRRWLRAEPLPTNAAGQVMKPLQRATWPVEQPSKEVSGAQPG